MLADDAMNAEEVAQYLGIGKNSVYQLAKSGQLASYHLGRKLRFTLRDVNAYLEASHQVGTEGAAVARTFTTPASPEQTRRAQGSVQVTTPVGNPSGGVAQLAGDASPLRPGEGQSVSEAAQFTTLAEAPFVIAGGEIAGDVIANYLISQGVPMSRTYQNSYTALVNLYGGYADIALSCLYDLRSNSYNVQYVRRLVPGISVIVLRLYRRTRGFIVQRRNPRNLNAWGSLLREGVRLVNSPRGSASRVLLDEKLRSLEARAENIAGYADELLTPVEAASRVAIGAADVSVGTRRDAHMVGAVGFVPLQTECVDLTIVKNDRTRPLIRRIKALLADDGLRCDLEALEHGDLSGIGGIAYES